MGLFSHAHMSYSQSCTYPSVAFTVLLHDQNGYLSKAEQFILAIAALSEFVMQGCSTSIAFSQLGSVFQEFPNVVTLVSVVLKDVKKSSLLFPLYVPQRPDVRLR